MPTPIKIKGETKEYNIPSGWEDVTLNQYIKFFDTIQSQQPKALKDIYEAETAEELAAAKAYANSPLIKAQEVYPYFARYVSFWSGIPYDKIMAASPNGMRPDHLEALYFTIEKNLAKIEKYDYHNVIEYRNQNWYLPTRYMKNSTVIEFAECAQFEAECAKLKKSKFHALPNMLAVLLRKKGESYNSSIVPIRAKHFLGLPMHKVFHVAFFLMRLQGISSRLLGIYTGALQLKQLKQELDSSESLTAGI